MERSIVKVEAEDHVWHVWLSCGHEATFIIWPHSPTLVCAQCIHDFLEEQRCPSGKSGPLDESAGRKLFAGTKRK